MTPYVALLRGINVGPGRAVPMAELRSLAEGLGWQAVRTYIQSGNLVFDAEGREASLAAALEATLALRYPFSIPVLVRSVERWCELVADRPFGGWRDDKQLSLTLLEAPPDPTVWVALEPKAEAEDAIELIGDRVWVKTPTAGYGKTRFNNAWLEKKLKTRATTRNYATVEALLGLLDGR